jgi:Lon-like protease
LTVANIRITPLRVVLGLAGLIIATLLILYRLPSDEYILLPDVAHPVAPLVQVKNAHPPANGGKIYFVDVFERKATELDTVFPWLHPHATFLPAKVIVPPGSSDQAVLQAERREMSMSQRIAAAVALRQLHYPVVIHPDGVLVNILELGTPASTKLESADVVEGVNGTATPTLDKLHAYMSHVTPGQAVTLKVLRGAKTLSLRVRTFALRSDPSRALIGFEPAQAATIKLPIHVAIDAGNIGGPSAGLAFTLEVMEQLGVDVAHGHQVAATGEINLDGTVGAIGGVKQKTYGVRALNEPGTVFLVPAGQNAKDARHYAGPGVTVIAVRSLAQALHALATLPPVR